MAERNVDPRDLAWTDGDALLPVVLFGCLKLGTSLRDNQRHGCDLARFVVKPKLKAIDEQDPQHLQLLIEGRGHRCFAVDVVSLRCHPTANAE